MSYKLKEKSSSHQLLNSIIQEVRTLDNLSFLSFGVFSLRQTDALTPESLSMMWQMGLKTAKITIQATTQKCIHSTGMLSRRFKSD